MKNEELRQKQILNPSYITGGNDDDIGDNKGTKKKKKKTFWQWLKGLVGIN